VQRDSIAQSSQGSNSVYLLQSIAFELKLKEVIGLTTPPIKKLRRRQRRKRKLHKLRQRLAKAKNANERQQLIDKIRRISPRAPVPDA
jgi:hypothetical protein